MTAVLMLAAVAPRAQSLPHRVHHTGRNPMLRAADSAVAVATPYGGRYHRGRAEVIE